VPQANEGATDARDDRVGSDREGICQPLDERPTDAGDDNGGDGSDGRPGDHVARIVEPFDDPRDRYQRGYGNESEADPARVEQHRNGDRKRCRGVVTRKGRVERSSREEMHLIGVRGERSRTCPDKMGEELIRCERKRRGQERGEACTLPHRVSTRPSEQPQTERCCGEHWYSRGGAGGHWVLEPIASNEDAVQRVRDRPIQAAESTRTFVGSSSRGSS
jgi:hypothetical protein